MDWMLGVGMGLSAVFAALGGVLILAATQAGRVRPALSPDTSGEACFLFDGDALVDATPNARTMLALAPQAGTAGPADGLAGAPFSGGGGPARGACG